MCTTKVSPALVTTSPLADISMPELSMATCPRGSLSTAKISAGDAATARCTSSCSGTCRLSHARQPPGSGEERRCAEPDHWTMTKEVASVGSRSAPWLARLSFLLVACAIAVVGVEAGLRGFGMLAVGLAAAVVSLAAGYLFLSRRGVLRWLALVVFAAAPIAVIVVYALHSLLWVALLAAACGLPA